MVHFLFGNSGCGKSTFILDNIKKDCLLKKKSFLIVPEQQTVISERLAASALPPSAQLLTEVINFTRLSNKIFREFGGLKYNYITKSGKNLIMYQAVCEVRDFLTEYKIPKEHEKGCVALFLDAIGELKSYSVSVSALEAAAENIENERLKKRLNDIVLIYAAYERILHERFSDPYDDILMLAKKLETTDYFRAKNVYIDSFYGFTKSQSDVLYHIIKQADNVTIALDCPRENAGIQYAKIYNTAKDIEHICRRLGKEVDHTSFDIDFKHKAPDLKHLCDNIWNFGAKKLSDSSNVELVYASDEFDECDYIASKIRELTENGAKYSDIAIIARNSDTYSGIIDVSLKKYNIPYYFSVRTDIAAKPVVKMLFSAFSAINGYRAEDIISYLKCGYTNIDENDIDDIENYIYRWNIYGKKFKDDDFWSSNPDGYVSQPTASQLELLSKINRTRDKIIEKLSILERTFSASCTVTECARAVFEFFNAHKIKEQLDEEIKKSSKEEAYETAQIWNVLMSALDTVVYVMNDTRVSPETFSALLRYAFDGTTIGTIPTGEDNVTVGDAPILRTDKIKHVFVIGVNEGVFPAVVSDDGFFSDNDKISLETAGISLSAKNDIRSCDELLYFKNSIAIASDSITISCIRADINGTIKHPSIAFERLKELFENIKITDTSLLSLGDRIYTIETAKEYVCLANGALREAVANILGNDITDTQGFSNDDLSIARDNAKELFGTQLYISQSKIETFVNCKFKYYCSYLLKLKPNSRISFSSREIGNLSHDVFEKFLCRTRDGKVDFSKITDDEIKTMVNDIIEKYISSVCKNGFQTNRLIHLIARLRSNLLVFIRNIVDEFAQCDFRAEYFELSFSGDGTEAPAPLKFRIGDNSTMSVYGIADRIDLLRKDGITYVRIVDYKTGTKKFSRSDIEMGTGLQMLIYLFTICKMNDCAFKKLLLAGTNELRPAGILYFPLKIGKTRLDNEMDINSDEAAEAEKRAVKDGIERNGIFLDNIEILQAQDKELKGNFLPEYPSHSKDTFISLEQFDEIYKELENTLSAIGASILNGDAAAVPLSHGGKSVCDYCDHIAVCRRRIK